MRPGAEDSIQWDNQQMDEALRAKLGDRQILVLAIEDTPSAGQATTVIAVTRSVPTTVNIEGAGSVDTEAFIFSQEEAAQLAKQIADTLEAARADDEHGKSAKLPKQ